MVVVVKPLIQVLLQLLDGSVKLGSEGFPEELIEDRAVEALYESVGPWSSYLRSSVRDIGEFQKDLIGMDMGLPQYSLPLSVMICSTTRP